MGNTGYAFQIEEKMQGFFLGMPSRHTAGNWAEALLGTRQKHCWELGRSTAGNWAEALVSGSYFSLFTFSFYNLTTALN